MEVDFGVVGVAGVAFGEGAEEGVGQETGDLLLGQSQGVVLPGLQQGDGLTPHTHTHTHTHTHKHVNNYQIHNADRGMETTWRTLSNLV